MPTIPLSIQLYTLRDHTAKDFAGTVQALAKIGYKGVELAGYGNLKSASEVRAAVDQAGLVVTGAHISLGDLLADPGKFAAEHHTLGNKHVIVPWAPLDGKDADAYLQYAPQLNTAGKIAAEHGLTLAYHNHSFEHRPLGRRPDGSRYDGLDLIYENTSPDLVLAELDLFWTQHGGHNPAKYLEKFGKRAILVHLKDMEVGPDRRFANVGDGIIDFPSIISTGQKTGIRWYIVEQDNCYTQDPLDAAKTSFANLKKMGYA